MSALLRLLRRCLRVFKYLQPQVGEPQVSRRPIQKTDSKLILKLGDAPAHSRNRHAKPSRRLGEAFGFDDFRKDD